MSFRNYIAASYNKKIYLETQELQRENVKFAIAKNIVLSECYLQEIEWKAIMEALNYKFSPKTSLTVSYIEPT